MFYLYSDDLMQKTCNSSVLAMKLHLFYIKSWYQLCIIQYAYNTMPNGVFIVKYDIVIL